MKNKSPTKYIVLLILIIAVVISVFLLKKNYKSFQNSASNDNQENQNSNSSDERANSSNNQSNSNNNQNATSDAKQTINKFLNIIVSESKKTDAKTISTDNFYNSSFVSSIVNKSKSPPSSASVVDQNQISNAKWTFIVQEEYNIDNTNNAGATGAYTYTVEKINNKWLISERKE